MPVRLDADGARRAASAIWQSASGSKELENAFLNVIVTICDPSHCGSSSSPGNRPALSQTSMESARTSNGWLTQNDLICAQPSGQSSSRLFEHIGGSARGYYELKTSLDCSGPWLQSCGQSTGLYFFTSPHTSRTHYSAVTSDVVRIIKMGASRGASTVPRSTVRNQGP